MANTWKVFLPAIVLVRTNHLGAPTAVSHLHTSDFSQAERNCNGLGPSRRLCPGEPPARREKQSKPGWGGQWLLIQSYRRSGRFAKKASDRYMETPLRKTPVGGWIDSGAGGQPKLGGDRGTVSIFAASRAICQSATRCRRKNGTVLACSVCSIFPEIGPFLRA